MTAEITPLKLKNYWERKWAGYVLLIIITLVCFMFMENGLVFVAIIIAGSLYDDRTKENNIKKAYNNYLYAISRSGEVNEFCDEIKKFLNLPQEEAQEKRIRLLLSLLEGCTTNNILTTDDKQKIYHRLNTLILEFMNKWGVGEITQELEQLNEELEDFANDILTEASVPLEPYFLTAESPDKESEKK